MRKDYYSILELPANSSEAEILRAYRRLAKKYHPDVNKSPDAQNNFIEITEAYEYLISNIKNRNLREWKDKEYRYNENLEKFREEIRKKAQQQARMRYEEFKKQNEAFQKSGLNDFFL
jgi:curved DNA-binding protein CbpA